MVQGVNKEYIFYKSSYIEKYLKIIKESKNDYNFDIMAYCIMNNHAHFLIHTNDIKSFGKFMQKSNMKFANYYNKKENRCGVLFRNRYKAQPIYDIKYLINCIKYIHNNPVNANMVNNCEDYKYSSYLEFITNGAITKTKIMKNLFGENFNFSLAFKNAFNKRFMDIDEEVKNNVVYFVKEAVREFLDINKKNIIDFLSNKEELGLTIKFLKEECGFKYIEIQKVLDIPKSAMDTFRSF